MEEKLLDGDATDNLESLHSVRLTALLHDLMKKGKLEAAQLLGVNHKTLTAALDSGVLTPRLSDALEKVLLSRELEAFEKVRERLDELVGRVEAVEEQGKDFPGEIEGLRDEQAETIRRLERRLAQMESTQDAEDGTKAVEEVEAKPAVKPAWRPYRDVVTPEPGEEQIYGDAAPLIVEWREVRAEFLDTLKTGPALRLAVAHERMLELEIELIDRHELTLPPRTYPWDSFDRRSHLWTRKEALSRARVERARADLRQWLRRKLTFGLWR